MTPSGIKTDQALSMKQSGQMWLQTDDTGIKMCWQTEEQSIRKNPSERISVRDNGKRTIFMYKFRPAHSVQIK